MTSIGGYFASLDLVTNASSFERARKFLNQISSDALIAASSMEELQKKVAKNASSFFGSAAPSGKPNQYTQMNGFKMNPESGYMVDNGDTTEKEEQKRMQKRDSITKLASLYVMLKLLNMLKDVAVKLATLTFAIAQANLRTSTSASMANMSANAAKIWGMAAGIGGADPQALLSKFTSFNQAFVDLGLGLGEAFGAIANDVALLSSLSGEELDSKAMIDMGSDQRINLINKALGKAYKQDSQQAMRLAGNLLGPDFAKMFTASMLSGEDLYSKAAGQMQSQLSASDVKVGIEFGTAKATLDDTFNLLGQILGKQFLDEVMAFNKWMRDNKEKIRKTFENIALTLNTVFDAIKGLVEFLQSIDAWFADLSEQLNKWLGVFNPNSPDAWSAWKGVNAPATRAYADSNLAAEWGSPGDTTNIILNINGVGKSLFDLAQMAGQKVLDAQRSISETSSGAR